MPTLTGHTDDGPTPRADVLIPSGEISGSATTASVLQISSAGQNVVRGAERIPTAGGLFVTDFEVPLGIPVTYQATLYNSSGTSIGLTTPGTVQVNIDPDEIVVQDFLAPAKSVRVDADMTFGSQIRSVRPSQRYVSGTDTIVLQGEPGLAQQIPLRMNTRTLAAADMLASILTEGSALIRSMPGGTRLPQLLYVSISEMSQVPVDVEWGGQWVAWDLVGDQITRPSLYILDAVWDWALYKAAYPTWAAAKAAYPTWLAAKMNPPAVA